MSKKTVKRDFEVSVCDVCGRESDVDTATFVWRNTCGGCGKDLCPKCAAEHGVSYPSEVSTSHYGRVGFFCADCDSNPPESVKELHGAYCKLHQLEVERDDFLEDFVTRAIVAEKELERIAYGEVHDTNHSVLGSIAWLKERFIDKKLQDVL